MAPILAERLLFCLAVFMSMAIARLDPSHTQPVDIDQQRPAESELQRGDDLQAVAESHRLTVNGCVCQNDCRLSSTLNCNAQMFCNVEDCPGSRSSFGRGTYDYCTFPDSDVNTSVVAARWAALVTQLKSDETAANYMGGVSVFLGVLGVSVIHTMEMETDTFPYTRTKYVRPVGVVAPVKFESTGSHDFTGIFRGSDHGIIRLSTSLAPEEGKGFAPGVALKFLREGRPSANFVGFTNFEGQPCSETNFFEHNMYTHVPPATGLSQLVPLKFRQASFCHQMVGLSDAADDFDGRTPTFPFEIVFEGLPMVEFSCGDNGAAGWARLGELPQGTRLMRLKARRAPGDILEAIGDIILEDKLITSKFGDEHLFFRHQRMEEDFAIHPEWLDQIDKHKDCGTTLVTVVPPSTEDGCGNMCAWQLIAAVIAILVVIIGAIASVVVCARRAWRTRQEVSPELGAELAEVADEPASRS